MNRHSVGELSRRMREAADDPLLIEPLVDPAEWVERPRLIGRPPEARRDQCYSVVEESFRRR